MNIIEKIKQNIDKIRFRTKYSGSADYWESRYGEGGNSGSGSYGDLAEFKAQIINGLIKKFDIKSVTEFGCGDGHQLTLIDYPKYIGLDVSKKAIALCEKLFRDDKSKSFFLYHPLAFVDNNQIFNSDLSLSLDVIYHIIEDDLYFSYMKHLFDSANKYVIIFSIDEERNDTSPHLKCRKFSDWVKENAKEWNLLETISNTNKSSDADFYIYKKRL